ncbi:hydrogenase expression/formation protein HupK [Pseudooceanicola nitratireducens]|uniref:hydrogenase expression/formation protein HupK n=1 Tax=Pseudooceanicola nitratireducens TaxID=517719 RepID=UPI0023F15F74|nr:hydrogenase expression/formation protein HupK [Pseudooceanicola nitratireducens]
MTLAAPLSPPLVARRSPGLPLDRLVVGKPVTEVAALLPRLFSLCRAAQAAAVTTALGRPVAAQNQGDDIGREILRDHLLKLCVTWPGQLGLGARTVPPIASLTDTNSDTHPAPQGLLSRTGAAGSGVAQALFGPAGTAPATPQDFDHFLASDLGCAPVLRGIDQCFAPGEAVAHALPAVDDKTIWGSQAIENSTAARHISHPVMAHLAATRGHGPLWRAAARLFDVQMVLAGTLPAPRALAPGQAMVPATRGVYAVHIETEGDTVTALTRITPTDSLLAPGGVLDLTLASLPADKAGLGPLLLDILDPCAPIRLEARHA